MKPLEKTIWVFNQYAGDSSSGWGERHFNLGKGWLEAGYRVCIFSGASGHMFLNEVKVAGLYEHKVVSGIEFFWMKTLQYEAQSLKRFVSMLLFATSLFLLRPKKIGNPDIILVSSMPIFPILTALYFKCRYGSKVIFEFRDLWPMTLQLLGGKSRWHPAVIFISWFERLAYRYSDALVSVLPYTARHVQGVCGKWREVHWIPNGFLLNRKLAGGDPEIVMPPEASGKFIVGYAGTLALANCMQCVVTASKLLEDNDSVFFVIIGDGYHKDELMSQTTGQRNIKFLPRVPKSVISSYVERFDVCVVSIADSPLYSYGASLNKYIDYMLAKKPILTASNVRGDPVPKYGCGLQVDPESGEAIVAGIEKFLTMPVEERMAMGQRGFDYVRQFHNYENLSETYMEIFRST